MGFSRTINRRAKEILEFWFGPEDQPREDRRVWFVSDPAFDRRCIDGFLADHERAVSGALDDWRNEPHGALALILLLDQFPRNMFRGTARAFASDAHARGVAKDAIARRQDLELAPIERQFVYLPFMHSEDIADQLESVRLFRELASVDPARAGNIRYATHHLDTIRRFGRFPHRNALLGRTSTDEEVEFLTRKNE